MSVKDRVETILKRVAEVEGITNCEITPHVDALSGDGFLSEFYTGNINDKNTGKLIQVYIKVKPVRDLKIIKPVFTNEVNYYSKIFPELDKFQKTQGVKELFDKIPKYYCGSLDDNQEYLAFIDLKALNYVLLDKSQFIDQEHLELVFTTYGKYHALTFAFKASNPEKYQELIKPLHDIFGTFKEFDGVSNSMMEKFQLAYEHIKETNREAADKVELLINDFETTLTRGFDYKGKYSTLVHGDCWSNNIMFKYQPNGDLEDLTLLDHQLLRDTTPVHDLSYFFYSGASKADFDKLDFYLDLYYNSFSSFAKELGFDPNDLLPFEALKSDWKKYAFLGVFMGIMLWDVKFMSKKNIQEFSATDSDEADMTKQFMEYAKKIRQHPEYLNNISNILLHAAEYGVI